MSSRQARFNFDIPATLEAAALINSKRMELYKEGPANAITAILTKAEMRLNDQARAALTGAPAEPEPQHTDDTLYTCPRCHATMLYWQQSNHDHHGCPDNQTTEGAE